MIDLADPATTVRGLRGQRLRGPFLVLGLISVLVAMLLATALGPVSVSPRAAADVVIAHLSGTHPASSDPAGMLADQIVWQLRVPRVFTAALVGAALAVAGAVLQGMVRNPLADPSVLGVSAGASLTAVIAMSSATSGWLFGMGVPLAGFLGAVLTLVLVLVLARGPGGFQGSRIVLAGVGVGQTALAATSFVQLRSDPAEIKGILFWMLGSVAGTDNLSKLIVPAVVSIACLTWLCVQARALNALAMGDDDAITLGVAPDAMRLRLVVAVALLTGVSVSIAGGVGFIGLIVAHIVRFVIGHDYRWVLPATAVWGAVLLVCVDLAARTLGGDNEYPLTVFTAVIGGPFFLWLLRSSRSGGAV